MPRLEPAPSASATPPTSSASSERKKRKFLPIEELIRQNITNAPPASPSPIPPPKRKRPSASDQAGPSRPRAHAKTAKRARTAEEQAELDDPASGGMALWRAQVADILGSLRQRAQTPKREIDSGVTYTSTKGKGKERPRGPFVQSELPIEYKDFATRDKKYGSLWVRSERNWWPGYLLAFHPAQSYDEKDMWEVAIHPAAGVHRTKKVKAEGMIYRSDNRAADCSRGNYSSEDAVLPSDARTRASTPPIPSPSAAAGPSDPAAFDDLPAKDQLLYLRPHLQRIIDESYPPAQWRNEGFFSRNGKRRKMLDERKESGDVRQNEVMQVVEPELGRWLLRAERWETEPRPKDTPKTEVAPPKGSDRFNALSPADKSDYLSRVLRTEAFIQLRIRTEGLQKLAQAELNRRASDPDPDHSSSSSSSRTTDITSLAPSRGAEPPSARELPAKYLRSMAKGKDSPGADGAAAPEWVQYSLALALLKELRVKDEVMVWATIEEELKRCRRKARERLGLPDEHEGRAQRIEREKREKGYKPIWTAGRLTNKVEYDKLF